VNQTDKKLMLKKLVSNILALLKMSFAAMTQGTEGYSVHENKVKKSIKVSNVSEWNSGTSSFCK
jgi:hypothetical protein